MNTIISSTNRPDSNTFHVARYYQNKLKERNFETEILSLADLPDNLIHTDMFGKRSPEFQVIQDMITATEKFIFIIPEYNGSFPGLLKLFIDCCQYPESFRDKKAVLVGLSTGKYGNIRGIDHFVGVCHYIGLEVMPLRIHIPFIQHELDENKNLFKEDTLKFTNQQIDKIVLF